MSMGMSGTVPLMTEPHEYMHSVECVVTSAHCALCRAPLTDIRKGNVDIQFGARHQTESIRYLHAYLGRCYVRWRLLCFRVNKRCERSLIPAATSRSQSTCTWEQEVGKGMRYLQA